MGLVGASDATSDFQNSTHILDRSLRTGKFPET
jgi:hypothetical protein